MSHFTTFIAHGSKKEDANAFLRDLIREIGDPTTVNIGFLELATPSIPQALEENIQKGALKIRIIPLFLAPGRHTSEDIPGIISGVQAKNPRVEIVLEAYLGNRTEFKKLLRALVKV